jgi:transcriptional regulator with XRE-family HTH domain
MARTVGERVRELRQEQGLSIVDLSYTTLLSIRFLQEVEADRYKSAVMARTRNRLLKGLGVTLDEFMRGIRIQ